jgi:hypothetical protein
MRRVSYFEFDGLGSALSFEQTAVKEQRLWWRLKQHARIANARKQINVRSDVFAVGASLSIMTEGAKGIVPVDSFAIVDKAYGLPVLGKKLFAAL